MNAALEPSSSGALPDGKEIEDFLYHEAQLLDEQNWDEWNALFVDDAEYWVPASHNQPDAQNHVSLIYETELLRAVRIKRFKHPNAFSLQPKPRSVHFVSNVIVKQFDEETGICTVGSKFIMVQYRREEQDVFAGTYTHELKKVEGQYRINKKKVELVNCDAPMSNILLYL